MQRNKSSREDIFSLRRLMAESVKPKADLFNQPNGQSIKEVSDTLEVFIETIGQYNHTTIT